MEITEETNAKLADVFKVDETVNDVEGERLTVRFDPSKMKVYRANLYRSGKHYYRRVLQGSMVLSYRTTEGAKTPTGGVYTRRSVVIRTKDGNKWYGMLKKDDDRVVLHRYVEPPNENDEDKD